MKYIKTKHIAVETWAPQNNFLRLLLIRNGNRLLRSVHQLEGVGWISQATPKCQQALFQGERMGSWCSSYCTAFCDNGYSPPPPTLQPRFSSKVPDNLDPLTFVWRRGRHCLITGDHESAAQKPESTKKPAS